MHLQVVIDVDDDVDEVDDGKEDGDEYEDDWKRIFELEEQLVVVGTVEVAGDPNREISLDRETSLVQEVVEITGELVGAPDDSSDSWDCEIELRTILLLVVGVELEVGSQVGVPLAVGLWDAGADIIVVTVLVTTSFRASPRAEDGDALTWAITSLLRMIL
jgi:hypothetical protein